MGYIAGKKNPACYETDFTTITVDYILDNAYAFNYISPFTAVGTTSEPIPIINFNINVADLQYIYIYQNLFCISSSNIHIIPSKIIDYYIFSGQ